MKKRIHSRCVEIFVAMALLVSLMQESSPLLADEPNFQTTRAAAERGDAKAEYELGRCYERGTGVERDYPKAAEYIRKSAEQGYANAQTLLGSYYGRGIGVSKDQVEAVKWYRKAAEQGNALAQYAMGGFYFNGHGVTKDVNEVINWWGKAAEQNNAEAQAALGHLYFAPFADHTNHVSYPQAFKWLRKAAEQGNPSAMNNLGLLYEQGLGLEKTDNQEAAKWYHQAAEKGDAMAQANLGRLYLDGLGVPLDLSQGYKWLKLSADQGNIVGSKYIEEWELSKKMSANELAEGERLIKEYRSRKITSM